MLRHDPPTQSIPKDKQFCPACGEVKRIKNFTLDEEYCDDCCKKMRHSRPKWYGCLAAALAVLFSATAVYLCVLCAPAVSMLFKCDSLRSERKLYDAYDTLEQGKQLLESADTQLSSLLGTEKFTFFGAGENTLIRMTKLEAEYSSRLSAGYDVKDLFSKKTLQKRKFAEIADYIEIANAYTRISNAVSDIASQDSQESTDDVDYEATINQISALVTDDSPDYEKGYVEYYKASFAQYIYGDDYTVPMQHLAKMLEYIPDETKLYMDTLEFYCESDSDRKLLIEKADEQIAKNLNDAKAYYRKAVAMIALGDTDGAKQVCEQLNKYFPDSPYYYALMIKLCLMSGDTDKAAEYSTLGDEANRELTDAVFSMYLAKSTNIGRLSEDIFLQNITFSLYQTATHLAQKHYNYAIDSAYNNCYYAAYYYAYLMGDALVLSQDIIDITAISASLAHKDEILEELSETGTYSDTVKDFIAGKITLDDIIIKGEGDIV